MNRPRLLVLSPSNLATDPRVHRQLRLLQGTVELTAAGYADPRLTDAEFFALAAEPRSLSARLGRIARLAGRQFSAQSRSTGLMRSAKTALAGREFDLILANDVDSLPVAFALAGPRTRILLDAHEYAPREFEDRRYWRLLYQPYKTWLCRTYLPRVDGFTTVCDGIADEYARVFGVRRPVVVPNTPPRQPGAPRPTGPNAVRLVHHGLASRSRQLEVMIDLVRLLEPRFTLDLLLVAPEAGYLAELQARAAGEPRIRFLPPVPGDQLVAATREYDVGLFLLPPTNFNYRFALPNKFFEFLQARLAIAIGPSPEMAKLVHAHGCGVVSRDFTPAALAQALNALDAPALDRLKQAAHRAADQLCWENVRETLRAQVNQLLPAPCAA